MFLEDSRASRLGWGLGLIWVHLTHSLTHHPPEHTTQHNTPSHLVHDKQRNGGIGSTILQHQQWNGSIRQRRWASLPALRPPSCSFCRLCALGKGVCGQHALARTPHGLGRWGQLPFYKKPQRVQRAPGCSWKRVAFTESILVLAGMPGKVCLPAECMCVYDID